MKKVTIKYNPFTKSTTISVNGKQPKGNSSLNFGEKRLQEWAGEIPEILVKEYNDHNFSVEFTGTLADFEDLKLGFSTANIDVSFAHNRTADVAETEAEVDRIFEEIKNGPVPQLKDASIIRAFEKAKNLRFEINVVATMSSGKSTLINALLDHKLMPVAAKATTATIVNIIDTDIDGYHGIAYDCEDKEIMRDDNLTYQTMKEWNKNEQISSIDIEGRIPCVNSVGMRLVLVDTPGPNNAGDTRHKAMTYEMLADSDKSLVLFVLNGAQLDTDDETAFLDYVCDTMKKGGKQSRDRYIFAINQMDAWNPEEENAEDALIIIKEKLENRGIFNPNIFPVSALAAFEARIKPTIPVVLRTYKDYITQYPSTHYDAYYQYSHLPQLAKIEIEKLLKEAKENPNKEEGEYTTIELHSGIVSIEKAIELYINKYARTIKVYDLVQSFNNRLNELAAIATLEQEIKEDAAKKVQLEASIVELKQRIHSGESARQLSDIVDEIVETEKICDDIQNCLKVQKTKIDEITFQYCNSSKILKSEAETIAEKIEKENKDIPKQLAAQVNSILITKYETLYKIIIKKYESYLKGLGLNFGDDTLVINPLNLIAEDLVNLTDILMENTNTYDEGRDGTEKIRVKVGKRAKWRVIGRLIWGDDIYEEKTITKHFPKWVEYVDMSVIVSRYFEEMEIQLITINKTSQDHVRSETIRLKEKLHEQLNEINQTLERKLDELNNTINNANATAQELETKKKNLEWMNGIIERINKLINF